MKVEMKEYDNHCQLPSLSEVTLEPDFVKGKNGNLSREKMSQTRAKLHL